LAKTRPRRTPEQSIEALRSSLPTLTLVVLERQEHNAMDGGRDALADAIITFAVRPA